MNTTLTLYSITGEKVNTTEGQGVQGLNLLTWNLQNEAGSQVATGLYIYRIETEGKVYTGKVAIIH